ncbi:MAG: type II toxin-antitoxin system HicA family toxin [Armatimonadetes bacterium]|nr:type II toxin-antitoxin system HicA family toxin [Armatimonadota bacterium]
MVRLYQRKGWEFDHITGSHHIMKRGAHTVSIPVHAGKSLGKGLQARLLKLLAEMGDD